MDALDEAFNNLYPNHGKPEAAPVAPAAAPAAPPPTMTSPGNAGLPNDASTEIPVREPVLADGQPPELDPGAQPPPAPTSTIADEDLRKVAPLPVAHAVESGALDEAFNALHPDPEQERADQEAQAKRAAALLAWKSENAGVDPQTAMDVLKYSEASGLPPGLVARDLDSVKKTVDAGNEDWEGLLKYQPALADWVTSSNYHPAAAKKDLGTLQRLEHTIGMPDIAGAFTDAVGEQGTIAREALQWSGLGSEANQRAIDQAGAELAEKGEYGAESVVGRGAVGAVQMAPMVLIDTLLREAVMFVAGAPGAVAGLAAAAPEGETTAPVTVPAGAAATTIGAGEVVSMGFNAFETLGPLDQQLRRARGVHGEEIDPTVRKVLAGYGAALIGGGTGAMGGPMGKGLAKFGLKLLGREAVTEEASQLVTKRLLSPEFVTLASQFAQRFGAHALSGTAVGTLQGMATDATTELGKLVTPGQTSDFGSLPLRALDHLETNMRNMLFVAAGHEALSPIGHAGVELLRQRGRDTATTSSANKIRTVADLAAKSEVLKGSPKDFEKFVDGVAKSTGSKEVYVAKEAFDRLAQDSKIDPAELAKQVIGDDGQAYAQAHATGGDLVVPMRKWVPFSTTEQGRALFDDARLYSDAPTPREKRQLDEDLRARAGELVKVPVGELQQHARMVYEDYRRKAEATGKVKPEEADANARKVAAAMQTWSERFAKNGSKSTAWDLYRSYDVALWGPKGKGIGFGEDPLAFPPEEQDHQAIQELRADFEGHVEDHDQGKSEVAIRRLFEDPVTGLRNEKAAALDPEANPDEEVLHFGHEGMKFRNDDLQVGGHHKADELVRAVAKAAHDINPRVYRAGGDFAVRLPKGQSEAFLEKLRATVPAEAKGYEITGKAGKDLAEARQLHDEFKVAEEKAGRRAERGQRPKGLPADQGPGTTIHGERVKAQLAAPHFEHFNDRSYTRAGRDELFKEIHVEPKTGLLTKVGWNARPRLKYRASIDLNGLKKVQEALAKKIDKGEAHAFGDLMLEQFGKLAAESGGLNIDFTHDHGDEYLAQSDDEADIKKFLKALFDHANLSDVRQRVVVDGVSGTYTYKSLRFGFGIGEATNELLAEQRLNEHKEDLARRGLRGNEDQPERLFFTPDGADGVRSGQPDSEAGPGRRDEDPGQAGALDRGSEGLRGGDDRGGDEGGARAGSGEDGPSAGGARAGGEAEGAGRPGAEGQTGGAEGDGSPGGGSRGDRHVELGEAGAPGDRAVGEPDAEQPLHVAPEVKLHPRFSPVTESQMAEAEAWAMKRRTPERRQVALDFLAFVRDYLSGATTEPFSGRMPRDMELELASLGIVDPRDGIAFGRELVPTRKSKSREQRRRAGWNDAGANARREENARHFRENVRASEAGTQSNRSVMESHEQRAYEDIAHLESIPNRTPEQEKELVAAQKRLDRINKWWDAYRAAKRPPKLPPEHEVASTIERNAQGKIPGYRPDNGDSSDQPDFRLESRRGRGHIDFHPAEGGKKARIDITILAKADRSTLAHETAHFLSIVLGDLAQRADAPADIKADYSAILKHMGYESHEQRMAERRERGQLGRKARAQTATQAELVRLRALKAKEERFSHAWEQWLFEGKAPSANLVGTFARFSKWMVRIYRNVEALQGHYRRGYGEEINLSDDVRGAFSRILATDGELERMKKAEGMQPFHELFDDASPEERAAYEKKFGAGDDHARTEMVRRVAVADKQANNEELSAERDRIREETEATLDKDPIYRAIRYLRDGDLPDHPGSPGLLADDKGKPFKLDRAALAKAYGTEFVGKMPRGIFATKGEKGVSADELAPQLGFENGDAMVRAIQKAHPRKALVDEVVRQKMAAVHGSTIIDSPERLAREALDTLHNGSAMEAALMERRRLAAKLNAAGARKVPPLGAESLRRAARQAVRNLTVGELIAGDQGAAGYYQRAERTSAERMRKAYEAGKLDQALGHNDERLLNMHLVREALDARARLESQYNILRQATREAWQVSLGKADVAAAEKGQPPDRLYRNTTNAILQAVGAIPSGAALDPGAFEGLVDKVGEKALGFDPAAIRELLHDPRRWEELNQDQAENVVDAVRNIRHAASAQLGLEIEGQRIDKAKFFADAAGLAGKGKQLPPEANVASARGPLEKLGHFLRSADATFTEIQAYVETLDYGNRDGPMHKLFIDARREARATEVRLDEEVVGKFRKLLDDLPKAMRGRLQERVPGLAELLPIPERYADRVRPPETREALYGLFLHWGDAQNRQRIQDGNGWTEDQVHQALQLLSPAEGRFLQGLLDVTESLWPELAAAYEKRHGVPLGKVEAAPIEIQGEKFRGGYFPIKYDPRIARQGAVQEADVEAALAAAGYHSPTVYSGHTKSRLQVVQAPVSLELGVLPAHLAAVVHDIAFGDWVRQAGKVVLDDRFKAIVDRRLGSERTKLFMPWLRDVAANRAESAAQAASNTTGFLQMTSAFARNRFALAVMGLNLKSMVMHFTDPLVAYAEGVGVHHIAKAYLKVCDPSMWGKRPEFALSKELAYRDARETANIRAEFDKLTGKIGTVNRVAHEVTTRARVWMDEFHSRLIFKAAYDDAIARGMGPEEAARRGDDVLSNTLPSGDIAERSAILRTKSGVASAITFYGYANKMFNLWIHRTVARNMDRWSAPDATARDKVGAVADVAAKWLVMTAIGALGAKLGGMWPKDGEDKKAWFATRLLIEPLNTLPMLGSAAEAITAAVEGRPARMNAKTAPEAQLFADSVNRITNAIHKAHEGGRNDKDVWTWLELLTDASLGTVGQSQRTFGYLHAVHQGDERPRDAVDVAKGMVYGRERHR